MKNPHNGARRVIKRNVEYLHILKWGDTQDILVKEKTTHRTLPTAHQPLSKGGEGILTHIYTLSHISTRKYEKDKPVGEILGRRGRDEEAKQK